MRTGLSLEAPFVAFRIAMASPCKLTQDGGTMAASAHKEECSVEQHEHASFNLGVEASPEELRYFDNRLNFHDDVANEAKSFNPPLSLVEFVWDKFGGSTD